MNKRSEIQEGQKLALLEHQQRILIDLRDRLQTCGKQDLAQVATTHLGCPYLDILTALNEGLTMLLQDKSTPYASWISELVAKENNLDVKRSKEMVRIIKSIQVSQVRDRFFELMHGELDMKLVSYTPKQTQEKYHQMYMTETGDDGLGFRAFMNLYIDWCRKNGHSEKSNREKWLPYFLSVPDEHRTNAGGLKTKAARRLLEKFQAEYPQEELPSERAVCELFKSMAKKDFRTEREECDDVQERIPYFEAIRRDLKFHGPTCSSNAERANVIRKYFNKFKREYDKDWMKYENFEESYLSWCKKNGYDEIFLVECPNDPTSYDVELPDPGFMRIEKQVVDQNPGMQKMIRERKD